MSVCQIRSTICLHLLAFLLNMQRVTRETQPPSGFVSVKLNGVFIVFSIPLYQCCPALWSREHTQSFIRCTGGNRQSFVFVCVCVSGSFTPWTLLKGLIQRNPIRLSSFPPTAILVLLAQTGARYSIRDPLQFSFCHPITRADDPFLLNEAAAAPKLRLGFGYHLYHTLIHQDISVALLPLYQI